MSVDTIMEFTKDRNILKFVLTNFNVWKITTVQVLVPNWNVF